MSDDLNNMSFDKTYYTKHQGLDLPQRCKSALCRRHRVFTVGELVKLTADDILETRNLGRDSLTAIQAALARHGLTLRANP